MDEAAAVMERLARIEALEQAGVAAPVILDELRRLLAEAEEWTKAEGGDAGEAAIARLRSALAADMIGA